MARAPSYDFERRERQNAKAAKRAEKTRAKAEKKADPEACERSRDELGTAIASDKLQD